MHQSWSFVVNLFCLGVLYIQLGKLQTSIDERRIASLSSSRRFPPSAHKEVWERYQPTCHIKSSIQKGQVFQHAFLYSTVTSCSNGCLLLGVWEALQPGFLTLWKTKTACTWWPWHSPRQQRWQSLLLFCFAHWWSSTKSACLWPYPCWWSHSLSDIEFYQNEIRECRMNSQALLSLLDLLAGRRLELSPGLWSKFFIEDHLKGSPLQPFSSPGE